MEKSYSVSDHGTQDNRLGQVWDEKFHRGHFTNRQLTRGHGTQSSFRKLEAAAMHTDISLPAQYL